ncbi:MAG TPA: hypothetical protein VGV86_04450 [Acidimicrobiales bacterium]|nr:hypothetical protein [Acidimicrobiales bacterium]
MVLEQLLKSAASLLGPVDLVDDLTFSDKAQVGRLRMRDGATVVAKRPVDSAAFGRELQALQVLPEAVRPDLVAVGDDILVLQDLGPGPSLADLLLGRDPAAAETALMTWAVTLGQALHATLRHGTPEEPEGLDEGLDEMRQLARALDVPVPVGVDDDVASIASLLARPGPWVAFCPSDTCPDNNRVLPDGSVRLFDFEGAGWRHAAVEAAYCRAPFCTCWCMARLPEGMVGRMEAAFLGALAPIDPKGFAEVVTPAAVYYTLVQFHWFRRFLLDERPLPPQAPSTGRQNVYVRLLAVAAEREKLPALAEAAERLATVIVRRWPDAAAMPLYPAFR